MKKYPISIIIPVYKNYETFFKNLNLNKKYFNGCELIIMNDDEKKDISESTKKIYPEAKIINNQKNLGFAGNVNKGIKISKREYVFFMNSDVMLLNDNFKKAINYFKKNKNLFAVSFAQEEKNKKIIGLNTGYFKNGLINHSSKKISDYKNIVFNFWAEGGASIFRKNLIIKIGLFDEVFNPFYWEDVDLSYRAWKTGYEVIFDPKIVVRHNHESTIKKYFKKQEIKKIAFRNQLFFQWKNITDKDMLLKHIISIPKYIFIPGFFDALISLPKILKSRKKTVKFFIKKDREILNYFI